MDDDMFSMLDKTKKVKKSKARSAQNGSKAPVGKRRNRSGSPESDNFAASGEDGPSERKKIRTQVEAEVDPMEALESNGGDKMIHDQTMDGNDEKSMDVGDASVDMEVLSEASKPMPVVTDDFEQEAEREVAATSGFASVDEGEKMRLVHQVRHQVALPPNYPYVPISTHVPKDPPARSYKFTLDPFQRVAVNSIERNESVLVSAHTSAGKTVVAEYAIATCLNEKKRVVYTSPIKALSNQKYREMQAEFGDVGLMTGDVTINPGASCLVMTTEILRSMLYRGSEVMREVAWVVFDEIHYMRDKDRGVVWEETIILLPHSVRYVFLSATIPNSMQFAEWIAKLHNQPCHVVYTDFRPTPLQHYMFPEGGDGMYLVVDEKSTFREDNFQKAMGSLAARNGEDPADPSSGQGRRGKTRKGKPQGEASDIYKLVKMIMVKNLNPVIVFAFSKRECESLAMQMSKINMNKEEESLSVENIFNNALGGLNDEDKQLPQIGHILPLLRRGIGVHHGGLLPLLKEVIEILFQEGLIKVLFATETFSIGLNMPAKTVVFTSVQKFDGKEFRHLSGGEYIQMSGRAGRRGLDARGIVIMMCEQKLEPEAAKGMVKGQADRLDSAFHLGYNMILNLMRVEGVSPEYMLERCFYQFQNTSNIPVLEDELREFAKKEKSFNLERREEVEEYYDIRDTLTKQRGDYQAVITEPVYALPFLQSGRVVRVIDGKRDFSWGVVIQTERRHWPMVRGQPSKPLDAKASEEHIVFILLNCAVNGRVDTRDKSGGAIQTIQPAGDGPGEPMVIPVLLSCIESFSVVRMHIGRDLKSLPARQEAYSRVKLLMSQRNGRVPVLDPIANMGIKDEGFLKLVKRIGTYESKLQALPISASPDLERLYNEYSDYVDLKESIRATKRKITQVQNVLQMEELKNRQRVLRRLGFTSADDVLSEKARVACEISTGDELLLTEMIFSGAFNELSPAHCAAVLVCFVFDEKSETKPKLPNEVAAALRTLKEQAQAIAQISVESRLPIVPDEYVSSFKPELSEAVFKWCNGASFAELCKMCDVFEGSLIRCFRRLGELLRQMAAAARVIGNDSLEKTFEESLKLLERTNSIIFSPSLYL